MGGFAKPKQNTEKRNNNINEDFINGGRGETDNDSRKTAKNGNGKVLHVIIREETYKRLTRYIETEARRIESKAYITNEAINMWLDSKGFEK